MDVGTGIAVSGTVMGLAALAITVLVLFGGPKNKVDESISGPSSRKGDSVCLLHDPVTQTMNASIARIESALRERDEQLWESIKDIRDDVKGLISRRGMVA